MALRLFPLTASSNLRTMTSHFAVLQMCFDWALIASEKSVRPAARSTASTVQPISAFAHPSDKVGLERVLGTRKLSNLASSGMTAFGRTNAPAEISATSGVDGDDGLAASTTFAKCVGTEMFGGEPMTSCD